MITTIEKEKLDVYSTLKLFLILLSQPPLILPTNLVVF